MDSSKESCQSGKPKEIAWKHFRPAVTPTTAAAGLASPSWVMIGLLGGGEGEMPMPKHLLAEIFDYQEMIRNVYLI